jgi:hypothetical protein
LRAARCGGAVSGDQEQAVAFWRLDDGELRFADEQRPGERADVIVAGTLTGPLGAGEWAVASPAASLPAGKSVATAFGYRQGFRSGSRKYN